MNKNKGTMATPEELQRAVDAVHALLVIYNTAVVYQPGHEVFQSALRQKMPVILRAVTQEGLVLLFEKNEIISQGTPLNSGSRLFMEFSAKMQGLGIRQMRFNPGLDERELSALIHLMVQRAGEIKVKGLQALLTEEGLVHIQEPKSRYELIDPDKPKHAGAGKGKGPGAGRPEAPPQSTITVASAAGGSHGLYELDLSGDDWIVGPEVAGEEDAQHNLSVEARAFRNIATMILTEVTRHEITPQAAADHLTDEFDRKLNETVERVRQESELKIHRLNTVKDLVLKEMDLQHIAAIVVTGDLDVLAVNTLGEALTHGAERLDLRSPLGAFVHSRRETAEIEIEGRDRRVRLILMMNTPEQHDIVLVAVE